MVMLSDLFLDLLKYTKAKTTTEYKTTAKLTANAIVPNQKLTSTLQ